MQIEKTKLISNFKALAYLNIARFCPYGKIPYGSKLWSVDCYTERLRPDGRRQPDKPYTTQYSSGEDGFLFIWIVSKSLHYGYCTVGEKEKGVFESWSIEFIRNSRKSGPSGRIIRRLDE
ncbi:hypothetical protein J6590_031271 [Homalodisca vitripennis]|nr:hypothetical protein J6590_091427 [Homalodisca vitripennis]KAG8326920.1 hypothetical protein J6590_031271 [Homalodisca vitripennis]